MDGKRFDAWTRGLGDAASRRTALLALLGIASALAVPHASVAVGKAAKRAKKKCKKQVGKCKAEIAAFCGNLPTVERRDVHAAGEAECLADLNPCCEPLKTCNAGASTECFLDVFGVVDRA